MTDREPPGPQQQDMPWNDSPADSEAPPGSEEPEPAEVAEDDDGGAVDTTHNPQLDVGFFHHDSLDERLAEEEPERAPRAESGLGGSELMAPDGGDEPNTGATGEDDDDPGGDDDQGAEDAAMHFTREP